MVTENIYNLNSIYLLDLDFSFDLHQIAHIYKY